MTPLIDEPCLTCGRNPCIAVATTIAPAERCVLPHRHEPCRPRRAMDGGRVCRGHHTGLARQTLELPGMHEALVDAHNVKGGSSEIRSGGHAGLDLKDRPAIARGNIHNALTTWTRLVAEERGFTPPDDDRPATLARWLVGRKGAMLDWICAQPWVDEYADNVDSVHREAWRLLHPGRARHITVAACGMPLWTDIATRLTHVCPGMLVVTFRGGEGMDLERYPDAVCDDECGRTVPPRDWLHLADRDLRLTVDELALLWSVPLPTVRRWARDWESDGGRPARYSVAEAQRTLKRYRPDTEGVSA